MFDKHFEGMHLNQKNQKMPFFQKSDYTSLNCHLAKFDSNVVKVNV